MNNQPLFLGILVAATLLSGCVEGPYESYEFELGEGDLYSDYGYIDGEDFFPGYDYGGIYGGGYRRGFGGFHHSGVSRGGVSHGASGGAAIRRRHK